MTRSRKSWLFEIFSKWIHSRSMPFCQQTEKRKTLTFSRNNAVVLRVKHCSTRLDPESSTFLGLAAKRLSVLSYIFHQKQRRRRRRKRRSFPSGPSPSSLSLSSFSFWSEYLSGSDVVSTNRLFRRSKTSKLRRTNSTARDMMVRTNWKRSWSPWRRCIFLTA